MSTQPNRPLAGARKHSGTALALGTAILLVAGSGVANAAGRTCFRACLSRQVTRSDVTDDTIRYQMTRCRDACARDQRSRLAASGLGRALASCKPEPVSAAEFKALRAASPSFLVYAGSFTWDIHDVLPGKAIRQVEISYPTLDLDETTATGGGIVLPGETGTILINGILIGYPAINYALKVKAVYACDLPPPAAPKKQP